MKSFEGSQSFLQQFLKQKFNRYFPWSELFHSFDKKEQNVLRKQLNILWKKAGTKFSLSHHWG